jgi:hypothetical protein
MASLENWSLIMYAAMDSVAEGEQPRLGANRFMAIFFIFFVVFCAFFMLNLVIGVSIDKVRHCLRLHTTVNYRLHTTVNRNSLHY